MDDFKRKILFDWVVYNHEWAMNRTDHTRLRHFCGDYHGSGDHNGSAVGWLGACEECNAHVPQAIQTAMMLDKLKGRVE